MGIEEKFNIAFAAEQALREKQIQQNYRPVIGVHKWFARRPGTLFRTLMISEYSDKEATEQFYKLNNFKGVIGDPFMGGGTPLLEANRLGFGVVGTDINPMAYWIVRQELDDIDIQALKKAATDVLKEVGNKVEKLYKTSCLFCQGDADVKYFLWVKTQECPVCHTDNELFPGYLLAENVRHPKNVLTCPSCFKLNEFEQVPTAESPATCLHCGEDVFIEGPAKRNKIECKQCHTNFKYPNQDLGVPKHKLWAIEYHCSSCKPTHRGRFFKAITQDDLDKFEAAASLYKTHTDLPIPVAEIPNGDETKRLHRWGYKYFHEMFNERQLLSLGLLLKEIKQVQEESIRNALLTIFSDSLRYQNMLCRYDTYALKCQDIFSVHGFPIGLVQCENNVLGIANVGSGSFIHFVEKYIRAKEYCKQPFEKKKVGKKITVHPIQGETIKAEFISNIPSKSHQAFVSCSSSSQVQLKPNSLDGVFTDPPYFANVQYAELMDFCYVWLREGLKEEFPIFVPVSTTKAEELTGNITMGRDLNHFAEGLSQVFSNYANALKPGAPFVFTYHHNELEAYAPLVLALLDAGLYCTAVIPAPAEMGASLHISNTGSSIVDSIFISRNNWKKIPSLPTVSELYSLITQECQELINGGVKLTRGDARCIVAGHLSRLAIQKLRPSWDSSLGVEVRLKEVYSTLETIAKKYENNEHFLSLLDIAKAPKLEHQLLVDLDTPYAAAI